MSVKCDRRHRNLAGAGNNQGEKGYEFYISFDHLQHRFFTTFWRMLHLLGSW
jgi:hypothetical protein